MATFRQKLAKARKSSKSAVLKYAASQARQGKYATAKALRKVAAKKGKKRSYRKRY